MSQKISSRHEGNAGGALSPFGEARKSKIAVAVPEAVAHLACTQHTAWMLVNLLCRSEGVVEQVIIDCPAGISLAGRTTPFPAPDADLKSALKTGADAIGVVPASETGGGDYTICIGTRWAAGVDLLAFGNGWCGGISTSSVDAAAFGTTSALPFGPYVAACMAAGEVFKRARLRDEHYAPPGSVFNSLWDHRVAETPHSGGPLEVAIEIDALLAGIGAVGCAFLHSLWATPGIRGHLALADNDTGLDYTNLNRYVLFGRSSVGGRKASMAAKLLEGAGITFDPHDAGVETVSATPQRVVSAVDKNVARHAIQLRYPARLFSASTSNLRAELLRSGPPGIGACLACYNPPEPEMSDEEVRKKLLDDVGGALEAFATAHGSTAADVRLSLQGPRCGSIGEQAIQMLRPSVSAAEFAVGFVSTIAGTMLAAEFVKDHLPSVEVLSGDKQRAVFQFLNPLARTNCASFYSRDPTCALCDPRTPASKIWGQRFWALNKSA